jgi:hypothetical protein
MLSDGDFFIAGGSSVVAIAVMETLRDWTADTDWIGSNEADLRIVGASIIDSAMVDAFRD